jgi:NitT/TauT family transport system permease protein
MNTPARRFLRNAVPPAAAIGALLLLWESYVDLTGIPRVILPAPSAVGQVLIIDAGILLANAWVTLIETVFGFAAAMLVGLGFAMLFDRSPILRRAF